MSSAPLEIAATTVAAILSDPAMAALVTEYEAEARSPELHAAQPQWTQYAALEEQGRLDVVTAREAGELIGFVTMLRADVPHYGRPLCVVESLFVTRARRRTRAGRALIKAAEVMASVHGGALLVTAPAGSPLETILPRLGYRHSNTVFVKGAA